MNVIGALHQDLRCKTLNSFFEGDKSGCTSGASDRHGPPVPPAAPQDGLAQVSGLAFLGPKNSGEMNYDFAFLHHPKTLPFIVYDSFNNVLERWVILHQSKPKFSSLEGKGLAANKLGELMLVGHLSYDLSMHKRKQFEATVSSPCIVSTPYYCYLSSKGQIDE